MPTCKACGAPAVVQWARRPTSDELASAVATVQNDYARQVQLADPQGPAPQPPTLPTAGTTKISVYACTAHAVTASLGALVHASACSAPNPANLPNCDCAPESAPVAPQPPDTLPAGW